MGGRNRWRRYWTVFVALWLLAGSMPLTTALMADSDLSAANTLAVGSIDPKLTEGGPATQNSTVDESTVDTLHNSWEDYSHTNGTVDPINNTISLSNTAIRMPIDHVNLSVSYTQNDTSVNDPVSDAATTAATITILTLTYNGTDLVPSITDQNGNNQTDLDDLSNAELTRLDGIPANGSAELKLSLAGDSTSNDNIAGGDGIDFTLTIRYAATSWRDSDASVDNTIQYGS